MDTTNVTPSQQEPARPEEPKLSDGSDPETLFSMFIGRAYKEDKEMVDGWHDDAEGVILFVGLLTTSHASAYNVEIVDWSILCCGRSIAHAVRPEYSAEPAGHIRFLSRPYLSGPFYPTEWVPTFHPIELVRPQRILSAYMGRLGQRALVPESGHQYDLRPIGDIDTAVGASLSKACLPKLQPSQKSPHSRIL